MNRQTVVSFLRVPLVLTLAVTIIRAVSEAQASTDSLPATLSTFSSPLPPRISCPPSTGWGDPRLEVAVEGFLEGSAAELRLVPFSAETATCLSDRGIALPEMAVHNGIYTMSIVGIPDGSYRLALSAPAEYFRDPEGYLFQVSESRIVRFSQSPFHFRVIAPSAQRLPPCRDFEGWPNSAPVPERVPFESGAVCRAERTIALSIPPKGPEAQGRESEGILDVGYHYAGPRTFQDNTGVWGRNYVVDPGVIHPHPGVTQFVCERVYANNGGNWMEAGWVEHSQLDDRQYVYEYDSATQNWNFFVGQYSLSPGVPVETRVRYDSSISQWVAELWWDGAWHELATEMLGFTTADMGYNRGEIYTTVSSHPILPVSVFDRGYLRVEGTWTTWDLRWDTDIGRDSPYQCDMIDEYYRFNIHSPVVFFPLVARNW